VSEKMKIPGTRCLISALFCASAIFVFANDFKSVIVAPGSPLQINVPGNHFLVIRNFTQEGGTSRGVVMVTDANGQMANVLAAAIIDTGASATPTPTPTPSPTATPSLAQLEVINSVVIAGPVTVTVTCAADAMGCFITYRKDSE
jgi:hypothetical protein